MSYLHGPRIDFAGRFFSDVSTINNIPEAYEPSPDAPEPLWNPGGGATFDFLGCRALGGEQLPGVPMSADDPAHAVAVVGADDRVSAKLVDLDPDWQMSSEIWGLSVRLVDPANGEELLSGAFRVSGFRDLWPRQIAGAEVNAQPSGASYVSVLENVVYAPAATNSPTLSALRRAAPTDTLSIRLNVFGYFYRHEGNHFATGSLTGSLGPWVPGEPGTFAPGRRIGLGLVHRPAQDRFVLVGPSVAILDETAQRLVIDLGNAYPILDHSGVPSSTADLSSPAETVTALEIGVLASETIQAGQTLRPADVTILSAIDLAQAPHNAGVYSFPLDADLFDLASRLPLAVVVRRSDGTRPHRVIGRESVDGLYVRADDFVHRLDPGASCTATFYAMRRGEPAAGVTIHLASRSDEPALVLPNEAVTDASGSATITLTATDPGKPRGAIDGTIETVAYAPRKDANGAPDYNGTALNANRDVLVAHVREAYDAPALPQWSDIEPILRQYARLYPFMREHLVDLARPEAVLQFRGPMLLAMTRDIGDPNYMPVTRDLSAAKRAAIVRWLETSETTAGDVLEAAQDPLRFDAKSAAATQVGRDALSEQDGGAADTDEG